MDAEVAEVLPELEKTRKQADELFDQAIRDYHVLRAGSSGPKTRQQLRAQFDQVKEQLYLYRQFQLFLRHEIQIDERLSEVADACD